jgi:protein gp37
MTRRLEAMGQADYAGLTTDKHFNGELRTLAHKLDVPLRRKKPTMWFVNSMSDLFHKEVPAAFVAEVFATMYNAQWHTFQILTKRPERMADLLTNARLPWAIGAIVYDRLKRDEPEKAGILSAAEITQDVMDRWPLPNVWLGTSVENQEQADQRIPHLLQCPAAVRFLSIEPLLGVVTLPTINAHAYGSVPQIRASRLGSKRAIVLDWVIVGGESGPRARPMHPDWARSLRDQCVAAGVPFFFKQWGEWRPYGEASGWNMSGVELAALTTLRLADHDPCDNWSPLARVGKKAAGRLLDGLEWNEMPDAGE